MKALILDERMRWWFVWGAIVIFNSLGEAFEGIFRHL